MPELPDIEVYLQALRTRVTGEPLEGVRLGSPFLEELEARKRGRE